MVKKYLKKGTSFAAAFAVVLSLSCCGVGDEILIDEIPTETTTEEMTEESTTQTLSEEELDELVQSMPEIVFVMSYELGESLVAGFFVTNTGEIKIYDFRPHNFKSYRQFEIPDVYDKLEEATCDVLYKKSGRADSKKIVSKDDLTDFSYDELVGYYKRLLLIEGDAERIHSSIVYHGDWGVYKFYGIKNNDDGIKECIILYGSPGYGDYFIHSNPDAEEMYSSLLKNIPYLCGTYLA